MCEELRRPVCGVLLRGWAAIPFSEWVNTLKHPGRGTWGAGINQHCLVPVAKWGMHCGNHGGAPQGRSVRQREYEQRRRAEMKNPHPRLVALAGGSRSSAAWLRLWLRRHGEIFDSL